MATQKGQLPKNFDMLRPHSWKKGQSGNPKGKPRNRIPDLLADCVGKKRAKQIAELTSYEVESIESMIMSLDLKALQAIAKNDNTPTYMKTLAMAAILDMKNGRSKTMDLLRDRRYGSIKKNVDVTTDGQSIASQPMTPNEAKEMLKHIESRY